jgi:cardiolipin synthase
MAKGSSYYQSQYESLFPACLFLFFCIFSFSGCAQPPRLDDALLASWPEKDRLEIIEAHRVLPPEKVDAIIRRLEKQVGPTEILKRHIVIMEVLSDSPLVGGNNATLLVDGPATYGAMEKAIQGAQDHINFESYIFSDDKQGRQFADLLLKKQTEGVQVNLMYDSLGSLNTPADFFKKLKDGGIQVLEVNPIASGHKAAESDLTNRDHRKILVVDGKIAFTGGINISGVYERSYSVWSPEEGVKLPWRDTDVRIEGPAVAEFQKLFLKMWTSQKGPPLAQRTYFPSLKTMGHELVRVVGSEPGEKNRLTYLMYVSAITFASKSVHLTNAYFAPDKQTRDAFVDAAGRGVDVKLILPSKSDISPVFYAARSYYEDLLEAGVKVYERQDAILHAKTAVVDGVWSTVGSTNMDLWSFLRNYEVNVVILGPDFAAQMESMFTQDLDASKEITAEEWKKRSFSERVKEWFSRLLQYWL